MLAIVISNEKVRRTCENEHNSNTVRTVKGITVAILILHNYRFIVQIMQKYMYKTQQSKIKDRLLGKFYTATDAVFSH